MVIYRCWEQIYAISACKYEDIWKLRSQHARVCGMIINNNGKYIFTVNQIKINFQLGLSIWYTTEKVPSCFCWFWTFCICTRHFQGFWVHLWTYIKMTPIQAPSAQGSHFSSALSSVTDVPVFSPGLYQPWLVDLTWGMTCHFPSVCWGLGCWWNLPLSSSADWDMHRFDGKMSLAVSLSPFPGLFTAHALSLLRNSSLEALDYNEDFLLKLLLLHT